MNGSPELVEKHVRAFNHGVRTGDWEPMLASFADDAEVRFENAPAGPFSGSMRFAPPIATSRPTTRSGCSASRTTASAS